MVKQEQKEPFKLENVEVKEEKVNCKFPTFCNRVSPITTIMKSESRVADAPRNSVVMAPGVTVTRLEMNKEEEAEQAVVRSNQQAKIPLKKRELKLADSFHSNHLNNSNSSSIIVCNPLVIQSKDSRGREGKVTNTIIPPADQASSQQQQLVVTASRQELINGRAASLILGHVGVIRSSSEHQRTSGAKQQEQNRLCLDPQWSISVKEEREVRQQSVLVRKDPVEEESMAALPPHTVFGAHTATNLPLPKSDQVSEVCGRTVDSLSVSSLSHSTDDPKRQTPAREEEQLDKAKKTGLSSHQQKYENLHKKENRREMGSRLSEAHEGENDYEKKNSTLGNLKAKSGNTVPPLKVDQDHKNDCEEDGGNGCLAAPLKVKDTGLESEERQAPLEEASSELQKEGIRLKIKIPPHRRNNLSGKGGKEEKQRKQHVQEEGRPLRRSARICRYV